MPDERALSAEGTYNEHLRAIREKYNLSLDGLYDETKIPRDMLQEFERSGLLHHPQFNRVYLRSFVRTYAQAVGIDADVALESLESSFDGEYRGQLATAYLGADPLPEEAEPVEEIYADDEARASEDSPPFPAPLSPGMAKKPAAGGRQRKKDVAKAPPPPPPAEPPPSSDPDMVGSSSVGYGDDEGMSDGVKWALAVVGLLVAIALIWFLLRPGAVPTDPLAEGPANEEVVDEPRVEDPVAAPAPEVRLGETINVELVAAGGPLREVRVRVDDDVRRPYWVEAGEAHGFQPREVIVIYPDRLENARIRVEGREFPMDRRDDQNRIVISREVAEAFLREQPAS
jgi:hypothetical protein